MSQKIFFLLAAMLVSSLAAAQTPATGVIAGVVLELGSGGGNKDGNAHNSDPHWRILPQLGHAARRGLFAPRLNGDMLPPWYFSTRRGGRGLLLRLQLPC